MVVPYQVFVTLALHEFSDIVSDAGFVGGTGSSPNKLRLMLIDESFLDIWLSTDGDYAYHWEQRRQRGRVFRWDNAPHHPLVSTFPHHFHDSDEAVIRESSSLGSCRGIATALAFVRQELD